MVLMHANMWNAEKKSCPELSPASSVVMVMGEEEEKEVRNSNGRKKK